MTYQELQKALEIFGLGQQAGLSEIKQRYRELAKRYHPDSRPSRTSAEEAGTAEEPEPDEKKIRQINAAYQLLLAYTSSYLFSFTEEEFYRQSPEQRLQRQFGNDPLWGDGWR